MSVISSWLASYDKGPWISCLRSPLLIQLLSQIFKLLSLPTNHLLPLLNISIPLFIAAQFEEHRRLFALTAFILLWVQYFHLKTWAHSASFSIWNLQLNLVRRATFLPVDDCNPSPPSSFDLVTFYQPTQCTLLVDSVEPHKKFLLTQSIPSKILTSRWVHCMT